MEEALLPARAVDEVHVLGGELDQGIGRGEIGHDDLGVDLGIGHHIGHFGLAPPVVLILVAGGAGLGAHIVRGGRRPRLGLADLAVSGRRARGTHEEGPGQDQGEHRPQAPDRRCGPLQTLGVGHDQSPSTLWRTVRRLAVGGKA